MIQCTIPLLTAALTSCLSWWGGGKQGLGPWAHNLKSDQFFDADAMNSRSCKLLRHYSYTFNLSNVVELSKSWIRRDGVQVRSRNIKTNQPSYFHVLHCCRRRRRCILKTKNLRKRFIRLKAHKVKNTIIIHFRTSIASPAAMFSSFYSGFTQLLRTRRWWICWLKLWWLLCKLREHGFRSSFPPPLLHTTEAEIILDGLPWRL